MSLLQYNWVIPLIYGNTIRIGGTWRSTNRLVQLDDCRPGSRRSNQPGEWLPDRIRYHDGASLLLYSRACHHDHFQLSTRRSVRIEPGWMECCRSYCIRPQQWSSMLYNVIFPWPPSVEVFLIELMNLFWRKLIGLLRARIFMTQVSKYSAVQLTWTSMDPERITISSMRRRKYVSLWNVLFVYLTRLSLPCNGNHDLIFLIHFKHSIHRWHSMGQMRTILTHEFTIHWYINFMNVFCYLTHLLWLWKDLVSNWS